MAAAPRLESQFLQIVAMIMSHNMMFLVYSPFAIPWEKVLQYFRWVFPSLDKTRQDIMDWIILGFGNCPMHGRMASRRTRIRVKQVR